MSRLIIPSIDYLCPRSDLDDGIDEGLDQDTSPGTYLKIIRKQLIPIAFFRNGRYEDHALVSPQEAQELYEKHPTVYVLPVKVWYQSHPGF